MNRAQRRAAGRTTERTTRRGRRTTALGSAALLAAVGGATAASTAPAGADGTLVVDSLADDGSGGTTLREALVAANTNAGKDVITFSVTGTITLTSNLPGVTEALDVTGPGSGSLTIDGDGSFSAFYFGNVDAADGTSSVTGLSIVDTYTASFGAAVAWVNSSGDFSMSDVAITGSYSLSNGGAIELFYNTGAVTLTHVTVRDSTSGINGGALYADTTDEAPFDLTITSSSFTGNTATGSGGGLVLNSVNATLTDVNVSDNEAQADFGGGGGIWISSYTTAVITGSTIDDNLVTGRHAGGGGIEIRNASLHLVASSVSGNETEGFGGGAIRTKEDSELTIERSTMADNVSANYGGALYLRGWGATTIVNSTVSGNIAAQAGGIYLGDQSGLTVVQSTITGNEAVDATNLPAVHGLQIGGGPPLICDRTADAAVCSVTEAVPAGTVNLAGTILAGNGDLDVGVMPDLTATVISQGSILGAVDPPVAVTDLGGTRTGITAAALVLGPLADNGGPTLTRALGTGSVAIDAGPATVPDFPGNAWDQRGEGYARTVNGVTDVGAYEVQPPEPEPVPEPTFTG